MVDKPLTPAELEEQRKRVLAAAKRKLSRSRRLLQATRERTARPVKHARRGSRPAPADDQDLPKAA